MYLYLFNAIVTCGEANGCNFSNWPTISAKLYVKSNIGLKVIFDWQHIICRYSTCLYIIIYKMKIVYVYWRVILASHQSTLLLMQADTIAVVLQLSLFLNSVSRKLIRLFSAFRYNSFQIYHHSILFIFFSIHLRLPFPSYSYSRKGNLKRAYIHERCKYASPTNARCFLKCTQ